MDTPVVFGNIPNSFKSRGKDMKRIFVSYGHKGINSFETVVDIIKLH